MLPPEIVGNKAKGRISKRVFQENNARQIFRKNEHFLPPQFYIFLNANERKLVGSETIYMFPINKYLFSCILNIYNFEP